MNKEVTKHEQGTPLVIKIIIDGGLGLQKRRELVDSWVEADLSQKSLDKASDCTFYDTGDEVLLSGALDKSSGCNRLNCQKSVSVFFATERKDKQSQLSLEPSFKTISEKFGFDPQRLLGASVLKEVASRDYILLRIPKENFINKSNSFLFNSYNVALKEAKTNLRLTHDNSYTNYGEIPIETVFAAAMDSDTSSSIDTSAYGSCRSSCRFFQTSRTAINNRSQYQQTFDYLDNVPLLSNVKGFKRSTRRFRGGECFDNGMEETWMEPVLVQRKVLIDNSSTMSKKNVTFLTDEDRRVSSTKVDVLQQTVVKNVEHTSVGCDIKNEETNTQDLTKSNDAETDTDLTKAEDAYRGTKIRKSLNELKKQCKLNSNVHPLSNKIIALPNIKQNSVGVLQIVRDIVAYAEATKGKNKDITVSIGSRNTKHDLSKHNVTAAEKSASLNLIREVNANMAPSIVDNTESSKSFPPNGDKSGFKRHPKMRKKLTELTYGEN